MSIALNIHRVVKLEAKAKQARGGTNWLQIDATDNTGETHDITFFMEDFDLARRIADNFNAAVEGTTIVATGPLEVS